MRGIARGALLTMAVATATLAVLDHAQAQRRARPVTEYCLRGPTGGIACVYHTLEQCRRTALGAGGSCMRNPCFKR
jgi:hypothetical protein